MYLSQLYTPRRLAEHGKILLKLSNESIRILLKTTRSQIKFVEFSPLIIFCIEK